MGKQDLDVCSLRLSGEHKLTRYSHKKDMTTGKVTLVGSIEAPAGGDHPRWVELHPNGHYLYALMEGGNNIAQYVIDDATHLPVFTHQTWPLIPSGNLASCIWLVKTKLIF